MKKLLVALEVSVSHHTLTTGVRVRSSHDENPSKVAFTVRIHYYIALSYHTPHHNNSNIE